MIIVPILPKIIGNTIERPKYCVYLNHFIVISIAAMYILSLGIPEVNQPS